MLGIIIDAESRLQSLSEERFLKDGAILITLHKNGILRAIELSRISDIPYVYIDGYEGFLKIAGGLSAVVSFSLEGALFGLLFEKKTYLYIRRSENLLGFSSLYFGLGRGRIFPLL